MHFQRVHGDHTPERVFRSVVNASATVAIVKGDVLKWDIVDNSAVSGIVTDTRGARVLAVVAGDLTANRQAAVAGVAENAGLVTKAAQFRNDGFIMQVSGFNPAVKVTGTITQFRVVTMSDIAASAKQAAGATMTVAESQGIIGWAMGAAVGGFAPVQLRGLL